MTTKSDKSLVLIQSRFNSTRLPGKALLPIEGVPLVVLAALRAANTGKDVLVLTSKEILDDEICMVLEKYNIRYFRGSLDNVLERFYQSVADQPDQKIIFRLTADNVLPDGDFLDEMEVCFRGAGVDIMSCTPTISKLPYGVSAEIFMVKKLREAFENAKTEHDREHVTPYIYRNGTYAGFQSDKFRCFSNLRVTIDTLDDYISVKMLFKGIADIVNQSMCSLLHNFHRMKYKPHCEPAIKPMTLGTVQFGFDYGITNKTGKTKKQEAIEIVKIAITEGVEYIDTAAAYGESESVLGEALRDGWGGRVKVITKLFPFDKKACSDEDYWALAVRNSVLQSLFNLKLAKIDILMLHRADHILMRPIVNEILNLRERGLIGEVGVSVQNAKELDIALEHEFVKAIQMPFNILDYRWDDSVAKIQNVKKSRKLMIFARSSLLQGLLCSNSEDDWRRAGVQNSREIVQWLESKLKKYNRTSVSDLCIGYVNSQSWIDSVVIGIDSKSNLYSNLQSISMPPLGESALIDINRTRPRVNLESLDPSTWS